MANSPWIDPDLRVQFQKWVAGPFRQPGLFHSELAPVPMGQAIIGRGGSQKEASIDWLIKEFQVPTPITVTVEFGRCRDAMEKIVAIVQAALENPGASSPSFLLVIHHADRLCYDCESEDIAILATEIVARASKEKIMVLALCDRPRNAEDPQRMAPWAIKCQTQFFGQFENVMYASCPDADYNVDYSLNRIGHFIEHMKLNARMINQEIDRDGNDIVLLRDIVRYASQESINQWLQKVFYEFILDPTKVRLSITELEDHTYLHTGTRHICAFDAMTVESRFREACGKGPLVVVGTMKKKAPQPPPMKMISEQMNTMQAVVDELQNDFAIPKETNEQETPKKTKPQKKKKKKRARTRVWFKFFL